MTPSNRLPILFYFSSHSTHRTFGKQQWQQLYDTLNTWKQNLNQVKNSLLSLSDT